MIYEYRCTKCAIIWEKKCSLENRNKPSKCTLCGKAGKRMLSAIPSYFNRTHPDIKQDISELVAGIPASNLTEV